MQNSNFVGADQSLEPVQKPPPNFLNPRSALDLRADDPVLEDDSYTDDPELADSLPTVNYDEVEQGYTGPARYNDEDLELLQDDLSERQDALSEEQDALSEEQDALSEEQDEPSEEQDEPSEEQDEPVEQEIDTPAAYTPDDPRLIDAVAFVESRGNANAVGPKTKYGTAKGAHQFIDITWEQYGEGGDVFNKEDSAKAAKKYLNTLYKRYDGDINLALAAYNHGEGNVDKAIEKAGSNDYSDVTPFLPEKTQNYVPAVFAAYNATSPELAQKVTTAKTLAARNPGPGFFQQISPVINSQEFQSLSAIDQIKTINSVYQSTIPTPKIKDTIKKMAASIWSAATPEELAQLNAEFGTPDREGLIASGKDPVPLIQQWGNNKLNELEKMGIAPELIEKPFTDHTNAILADEQEAYSIRSKGKFGRFINFLGENERTLVKGALDFPASVAAAVTNQLGADALTTTITKLPDSLLGLERRDALYETDDKGYVLLNDDGTPRTRWQTEAYRSVGNFFGMAISGTGLVAAGAKAPTVAAGLFSANALIIGNQTFNTVYEQTGDKKKAYNAMLLTIPSAAAVTLMQASLLSKYVPTAVKGLSTFNQLKVFATVAAQGSIEGAVGNAAQDALQQGAEISQSGEPYSFKRTEHAAAIGAVGGAFVAPAVAGFHQTSKKLSATSKAKTAVNKTLQSFQDSHADSVTLDVAENHVMPEVTEALGISSAKTGESQVTFTKKNFTPDEVTPVNAAPLSPAELAEYTALLQRYTPEGSIHDVEFVKDYDRRPRPESLKPSVVRPLTPEEAVLDIRRVQGENLTGQHEVLRREGVDVQQSVPTTTVQSVLTPQELLVRIKKRHSEVTAELERFNSLKTEGFELDALSEEHITDLVTTKQRLEESIRKQEKPQEFNSEKALTPQEIKRVEELHARQTGAEDPNFVPKMEAKKALDNTLKYLTPDEIRESHQERGELLTKENLTEAEISRLDDLDNSLDGTDDPSYINKIRANEADFLARAKAAGEVLPVEYNAERGGFVNKATGEIHPFLKGALGQEEFAAPSKDRASISLPKAEHIPKLTLMKPLSDNFIQPPPFERTNEKPMSPLDVVKAVNEIDKLAAQAAGKDPYTMKAGGRLGKNVLGSSYGGIRVNRVRSLRDIPVVLHEKIHGSDVDLGDISTTNPKIAAALIEQARTFYPGKAVQKNRRLALKEGLTKFLENKLTRQPVHKDLVAWWDGEFKQQHPDIWKAYDKAEKLAEAYYSQTPAAIQDAMYLPETPGKLKQFVQAVLSTDTWAALVDKDFMFDKLDKILGLTGLYNNKRYKAFIDANNLSAQQIVKGFVEGDVFSDLYFNKVEQQTLKQIFTGLTPEQQNNVKRFIDLQQAAVMIKRQQNPGFGFNVADVRSELTRLGADPITRQKAEAYYQFMTKAQDVIAEGAPKLQLLLKRIRKANVDQGLPEHGYYIPFERQDEVALPGAPPIDKNAALNPFARRRGSDKPLKPFEERISNVLRNLTEQSLRRQIFDRLIFDYKSGRPVGAMIQKIPRRQTLEFETTYADILTKSSEALMKSIGDTPDKQAYEGIKEMMIHTGAPVSDILSTAIQWFSPETSLPAHAASKGYMIFREDVLDPNTGKTTGYEFYEVHPHALDVFSGPERVFDNPFVQATRLTKRLVQVGATSLKPAFHARNLVRDFFNTLLLGKDVNAVKTAQYALAELGDQLVTKTTGRDTGVYALASRGGLTSASYMGAMKEINYVANKNGLVSKAWHSMDKTLDAIGFITSLDEQALRLSQVRKVVDKLGIDTSDPKTKIISLQAIDIALAYKFGTVNYAIRGRNPYVNYMADVIPFFGARLAATAQTINAIKENPRRALGLGANLFALGTYMYMLNAGKKWYDEMSAETKAVAFTMDAKQSDGSTAVFAIPLDSWMSVFYSAGQLAAKAVHENPEAKDIEASTLETIRAVLQQNVPVDIPTDKPGTLSFIMNTMGPVPKFFAEWAMNKKLYENRPMYNERKQTTEQFTEKTSELMKEIGRVTNMSPDVLDYFTRTFASGPLEMEKYVEKQIGVKPVNEEEATNFFLRAFMRSATEANVQDQSSRKFYEALGTAGQQKSTETEEQGATRKFLNKTERKLAEVNKLIAAEKDKEKRDVLYTYRRELYRTGVKRVNNPAIELPTLDSVQEPQSSQ